MENKSRKYYLTLLKKNKQKFEREYGITRIGIFWSVARGEQNEKSEVDLVHNTDKLPLLFKQRITKDIIYV